MRLLLDTHSLLWYLTSDPRLSKKAATVLADPATEAFVSAATLWEIVIKASLGKLELAKAFEELFPAQLESNNFELLPVEIRHLQRLGELPFHHRDPFDRLLIAQAIEDSLVILGRDEAFGAYPVATIW
jgi:PIN domain nuclease of toxin-antitoxin system